MAKVLEKYSQYKSNIIFYTTATRRQAIAQFKAALPPCYLAGPSLTEGLDLPYEHVSQQGETQMNIANMIEATQAAVDATKQMIEKAKDKPVMTTWFEAGA